MEPRAATTGSTCSACPTTTPAPGGQHLAARGLHRAAAGRRPGAEATPSRSSSACPTSTLPGADRDGPHRLRWLMCQDVCKHCTARGLPRRLPDRLAVPHRVRHGRRAGGHLQRLRLLHPAPARTASSTSARATAGPGSARSATTGSGDLQPACAKACPTESIQFGDLDELRERAGRRVDGCRRPASPGPGSTATTRRRRRRRRRVLPAARRAGGVRPAARPGGHHPRPARHVAAGRRWPRWRWPPRRPSPRSPGGRAMSPRRRRGASMVPRGRLPVLLRAADPQGAGVEARHRRPTCSPAGWRPARRCSPPAPTSPAGRRCAAPAGWPRSARCGQHRLPGQRPGPAERFHHMLRVVKPTSPMSMGTWILAALRRRGRSRRPPRWRRRSPGAGPAAAGRLSRPAGRPAGLAAAAVAPALATYTAVLLADTAVPSWHEAYPQLPFVFAGSALASGAGVGLIARADARGGPARRMAVAGAALELVAARRCDTASACSASPTGPARRAGCCTPGGC